jgi:Zn-dependent protease with chaperone function
MGIVTALVAAYLLGWQAGPVLSRAAWPWRRPAVAVALWTSLLAAFLGVLATLITLTFAVPPGPLHTWVEHLRSCVPGHTHSGEYVTLAVALLVGAAVARLSLRGLARARRTAAGRKRHHEMVRLVETHPPEPADVCLIAYDLPLVYCLARRHRPIVMTTGTLSHLDTAQLEAVLEHERAHLRHRHHFLLGAVDTLHAALPWPPVVRLAAKALPELVEMAADDAAAHRCGAANVAQALQRLAVAPCADEGLAIGPGAQRRLDRRIERLESGACPPRVVGLRAEIALLAVPLCGVGAAVLGVLFTC